MQLFEQQVLGSTCLFQEHFTFHLGLLLQNRGLHSLVRSSRLHGISLVDWLAEEQFKTHEYQSDRACAVRRQAKE